MKGVKEAFIDAGEISQMLGIGMTKAYAIIKEYNAELEAKGYFTMRGKCPRKYFEQKIYGYEDYYNPDYEPLRNRIKVAEEMDYEAAVGDSVISEQDEVYIPPETNEMPEADIDVAENVISDANEMAKEITEQVNPASGGEKCRQNMNMGAKSAPKTTKWGQKAPPHKSEPKKCGGKKCRQNAKVGAKSAVKTAK